MSEKKGCCLGLFLEKLSRTIVCPVGTDSLISLKPVLVSACLVPCFRWVFEKKKKNAQAEFKTFMLGKTESSVLILGKTKMEILMLSKTDESSCSAKPS